MGRSQNTERNVSTLLIRKHVRNQLTVYSNVLRADTFKRPQENERERRTRRGRSRARFQLLPFSSLPSFFILRGKSVPRLLLGAHSQRYELCALTASNSAQCMHISLHALRTINTANDCSWCGGSRESNSRCASDGSFVSESDSN